MTPVLPTGWRNGFFPMQTRISLTPTRFSGVGAGQIGGAAPEHFGPRLGARKESPSAARSRRGWIRRRIDSAFSLRRRPDRPPDHVISVWKDWKGTKQITWAAKRTTIAPKKSRSQRKESQLRRNESRSHLKSYDRLAKNHDCTQKVTIGLKRSTIAPKKLRLARKRSLSALEMSEKHQKL